MTVALWPWVAMAMWPAQLSCPGHVPSLLLLHLLVAQRSSWLTESTTEQQLQQAVLSLWIPNTALHQLPGKQSTLFQTKPRPCETFFLELVVQIRMPYRNILFPCCSVADHTLDEFLKGHLFVLHSCLKERCRQVEIGLLSQGKSDRRRGNSLHLH